MTPGGAFGFVLFLWWLHGPYATLRGLGDAFHGLAETVPPRMLTARQVGALLALEDK